MEEEKKTNVVDAVKSDVSDTTMAYTGFWVRYAALVIDNLVAGIIQFAIAIPFFIIMFVLGMMAGDSAVGGTLGVLVMVLMYIAMFAAVYGYFIWMIYRHQATLGKMAIGARVVSVTTGEGLSFWKVVLRETVGKIVSALILMIGYIMAAFTARKQGLHDIMADSVVVYKDPVKKANKVVVAVVYVILGVFMAAYLAFLGAIAYFASTENFRDIFTGEWVQDFENEYGDDDLSLDFDEGIVGQEFYFDGSPDEPQLDERTVTGVVTERYDDRAFDGGQGLIIDDIYRVETESSGFGFERDSIGTDHINIGDEVEVFGEYYELPFGQSESIINLFGDGYYIKKI